MWQATPGDEAKDGLRGKLEMVLTEKDSSVEKVACLFSELLNFEVPVKCLGLNISGT